MDLHTAISNIRHDCLVPTIQCLKSYTELLKNPQIRLDKKIEASLPDMFHNIAKRLDEFNKELLQLMEEVK